MLFRPRAHQQHREERPKNMLNITDMLAFRDTWTEPPLEGFSVDRIIFRERAEKRKSAEIPKLLMSENGFKVRDKNLMDESERELRRVQSTLNKLTEQNFDAVSQEMLSHELIFNQTVLHGAVNIIFTKAVAEPVFSGLYAHLCANIAKYEKELLKEANENPQCEAAKRLQACIDHRAEAARSSDGQQAPVGDFVRFALIVRCQEFHDQFVAQPPPEDEETAERLRKQNMANIKFVGELYMRSLVSNKVVIIVCSTALSLSFGTQMKPTVTDIDVEMVINLFNVIGKRFDELVHDPFNAEVWGSLERCVTDKRFSMRIRFLLQNLLEWRAEGWKLKDIAPLTSSGSQEGGAAGQQASAGAPATGFGSTSGAPPQRTGGNAYPPQQQRTLPRATSMSSPDNYRHGNNSGGNRRQDRAISYNDFDQLTSSGGGDGYPLMPPPPFQPTVPPPPFPGAAPEINDEDRKLMMLAQPPKCFTEAISSTIIGIARDASVDEDWGAANEAIQKAIGEEAAHVRRMCAVYAISKKITEISSDDDRKAFQAVLNSGIFEANALSRGYSWCLTNAIANNLKEDYPRVLTRLVSCVVGTTNMDFLTMVRDIMARTANYLDALFVPMDGDDVQWEEDFIDVWATMLGNWKESRTGDSTVKAADVLDHIAAIKQRPLMRDIAPDFIMELAQHSYLDDDSIAEWYAANSTNDKLHSFIEQLEQLYPALRA